MAVIISIFSKSHNATYVIMRERIFYFSVVEENSRHQTATKQNEHDREGKTRRLVDYRERTETAKHEEWICKKNKRVSELSV